MIATDAASRRGVRIGRMPLCRQPTRVMPPRTGPLLALVVLLVGCSASPDDRAREGAPELRLSVHVSPTPATVGPNGILIELTDSLGIPLEDAAITLSARLDGGGAVARDVAETGRRGGYVVNGMSFPAAGEWVLRVRAELPDGRWVEIIEPIRVLAPPVRP